MNMTPHPKRIKLAHITFDMRIGGAERVIAGLAEHTDSHCYEISVICLEQKIGPFGMQLAKNGVPVFSFGRTPGFDTRLLGRLRRHIKQEKVQILHCHQYTPYVYGLLASLGTGARVIFTEHGRFYPDYRKIKRMILNPLFNRWTHALSAISRATRDALVTYENFPEQVITVIYNGIEDYRPSGSALSRNNFNIPENAFVLGAVSRLDPIKNHRLMLKALSCLRDISCQTYLLIVGDGPERDNLEHLARDMGIESNVIFTGFRQDARELYCLMDVFLLTSFSEGAAMTLLEAFSAGLPSIVTDVGGNPEIVKDGHSGFIIPSDDVHALVSCILRLFENKAMRKRLGDAARRRFNEKFSVDSMVSQYTKIYDHICPV
jgi:glycosyltransferase involved in cell wall biosynthesis